MTDDFEASLQVLRGFDTDITLEVNEIKVNSRKFKCFNSMVFLSQIIIVEVG